MDLSYRYKCHAQFVVFQPEVGPSGHVLHHVATLHSPPWDLVDFAVTNNSIWTVSITPEGENVVRYANIDGYVFERDVMGCYRSTKVMGNL